MLHRAVAALGEDADEVAFPHPTSPSMSSGWPLFPWLLRGPSFSARSAKRLNPSGLDLRPSQAVSLARRLSSSRYAWAPKRSPVTFPRSVRSPGVHPSCLGDLFAEVHDPRL